MCWRTYRARRSGVYGIDATDYPADAASVDTAEAAWQKRRAEMLSDSPPDPAWPEDHFIAGYIAGIRAGASPAGEAERAAGYERALIDVLKYTSGWESHWAVEVMCEKLRAAMI